VLIETLILLTSSFTMGLTVLAAHSANKSDKSRLSGPLGQVLPTFIALVATFVLGAAFLGMEVHEFMGLIGEGSGPSNF
jgi:cytochrome o ubiquinol oxidase subunit 3